MAPISSGNGWPQTFLVPHGTDRHYADASWYRVRLAQSDKQLQHLHDYQILRKVASIQTPLFKKMNNIVNYAVGGAVFAVTNRVVNDSATVIQRAWREHSARKKAKNGGTSLPANPNPATQFSQTPIATPPPQSASQPQAPQYQQPQVYYQQQTPQYQQPTPQYVPQPQSSAPVTEAQKFFPYTPTTTQPQYPSQASGGVGWNQPSQ